MEMETVGEPRVAPSGWRHDPSRYLTGIAYLLVVVVLWTSSNFLTSALESGPNGYDKPFFITYLNTTTFTLYLIPSLLAHRTDSRKPYYEPLSDGDPDPRARDPTIVDDATKQHPLPQLTVRETAVVSAWWSIGWFLANFMINLSLAMTSVASATILSATSSFFTLILGSWCGVETPTRTNVSSVFLSFLGVVLITRSDSSPSQDTTPSSHPILGDIAAIISALCYGGYVVLTKVKLVNEDRADPRLMLGFAGLYQTLALIPIFPILHSTGWERFQLPPDGRAWSICVANMGVTLVSDYLYILALLKTSPMLATVGLSMTIPLTLLISIVFPSLASGSITLLSLLGAGMVLGAFVLLSWKGKDEESSPIHGAGVDGQD